MYINYLKEKKAEHAFVKQAEYSSFYVKNSIDRSMKNLKLALAEIEVKRNIIEVGHYCCMHVSNRSPDATGAPSSTGNTRGII